MICEYKPCSKEFTGRKNKRFCSNTCRTYQSHGDTIMPGIRQLTAINNAKSCEIYHTKCIISGRVFYNRTPPIKGIDYAHPSHRREYKKSVYAEKARHVYLTNNPHVDIDCKECHITFHGDASRIFCSDKCAGRYGRRIRRQKERARLRNVKVDNVNPLIVFTKHDWHCALCGIETPKQLKGTIKDNAPPELDHIIPLSKGGEHSYSIEV